MFVSPLGRGIFASMRPGAINGNVEIGRDSLHRDLIGRGALRASAAWGTSSGALPTVALFRRRGWIRFETSTHLFLPD
jgi:hypothetical protein